MKNRLRINIFILITAILFVIVLVISNVGVASVKMATVPGSYGETYAKSHHIKSASLSDSNKDYFDQRYELFDYNFEDGGIVLEKYSGVSENLVIPIRIGGDYVVGFGDGFFTGLNNAVKNVYVPETITKVPSKPANNITVYCADESLFDGWKTETQYDSEFVNYLLGDLEFSYNVNGNAVDITGYTGNAKDIVVIPSYINGTPVRNVSMDMLGVAEIFVIPETVTSITGTAVKAVFGIQFAIQLVFTVLAFALALLTVNIILPRFKKSNDEYLLSSPQIVVTALYVLLQAAFCIVTVYFLNVPLIVSIAVSCILLVVFLGVSFLGGAGREHSKEISENIEEKTSFMRELKESTKNLADGIEDPEAKKAVQGLVDEIRFSKLSGGNTINDESISEKMRELGTYISEKNNPVIIDLSEEIKMLIKQR